jgi:hypothetical protein
MIERSIIYESGKDLGDIFAIALFRGIGLTGMDGWLRRGVRVLDARKQSPSL